MDPEAVSSPPEARSPAKAFAGLPKHAATSRLSVSKVVSVTGSFTEYKKVLVQETGFGGTLKIPDLPKINLKLSSWLMSCVHTESSALLLPNNQIIPIRDTDLHTMFGLPVGKTTLTPHSQAISPESILFIKHAVGLGDKGNHSLKDLEKILLSDISVDSSVLEKICFKVAYVIFVMGHIFDPSTKHEYTTFGFWEALKDPLKIDHFNWAGYVLRCLLHGVSKYKADVINGNNTIHLVGCHLALQVNFSGSVQIHMQARIMKLCRS